MNPMKTPTIHRSAAGFTLLEVLITIVVVAFGLLGLAGLQVFALKNNQSATMRVAATGLANDIIDRMKTNFGGVIAGGYNMPNTSSYGTAVPGCNGGGCTPAELAQNDLKEWRDRVIATLPGGDGIVCLDSTPSLPANPTPAVPGCDNTGVTVYVVKIWWLDDRSQANVGAAQKYIYTSFNP